MRKLERAAAAVCLGALAFAALVLATGAGVGRAPGGAATVDTFGLLREMLETPEYAGPREEVRAAAVAELEAKKAEIDRMGAELGLIPPTDQARGRELYNKYQQAGQAYQALSQAKQMEFVRLSGNQAADAYKKIHAAANAVAEREGYDTVFATRAGADFEDADSLNAVTQGILSRPLLRFPAQDDLTDAVRAEIGYTVVVPAPAPGEDGAAPDAGPAAPDGGSPAPAPAGGG